MIYFKDNKNPTMTELINWFQIEFIELTNDMKNSNHSAETGEPNAYHVEDSVWTHTMMVCLMAKKEHKINKISALFHDIGKPLAREVIDSNAPKPSMNGEERKSTDELHGENRKKKVHMRGHEGISFWYAIDPLYELKRINVINTEEMEEILHIISLHGTLFNRIKEGKEFKPEKATRMFASGEKFNRFVTQSRCDSLGRFYNSNAGSRADVAEFLGDEVYGENVFHDNVKINTKNLKLNTIHILVGLPASGKSTFIKNKFDDENTVVISKDNVIMEMGKELGICEYTDIYKTLTDEQHKEAYKKTILDYQEAVKKNDKDIVIDMTNMSKKSRGKWINNVGNKYRTKAWVFVAGKSMLDSRNIIRNLEEKKFIPKFVYENMMKTFLVPTLYEFDDVEYVFQD